LSDLAIKFLIDNNFCKTPVVAGLYKLDRNPEVEETQVVIVDPINNHKIIVWIIINHNK
jgi:hypothetical protein